MSIIFRFLSIIGCVFLLSLSAQTTAQIGKPMVLEIYPEYPGPNEKVKISLKSGSEDVHTLSSVEWFVNGEKILTDTLSDTVSISLEALGEVVTVSAILKLYNGMTYKVQRRLLPIVFDLLVEGNVYTPPGYQGRNIVVSQSNIRAVVNLLYIDENGNKHTSEDFFFEWQFDDMPVQSNIFQSNFAILPSLDHITSPGRIRVIGNHKSKDIFLKKIDHVYVYNPEVLLYENHPLYGIRFGSALSGTLKLLQKTNLAAMPLFFDKRDVLTRNIYFKWEEDNQEILSGTGEQHLQLTPSSDKKSANISVSVENGKYSEQKKYLQQGEGRIQVSL